MYTVWMVEPRSYATLGEARAAASAYERETGAIVAVTEDAAEATPEAPAPDRYNGWKNHATWHVALILGNDNATDTRVRAIVAEAYQRALAEAREDEYGIYRGDAEAIRRHCAYVAGEAIEAYCETLLGRYCDILAMPMPYIPRARKEDRAECEQIRFIASQCIASYMAECDYAEIGEAYIRRIAEDAAYVASATAGAAQ